MESRDITIGRVFGRALGSVLRYLGVTSGVYFVGRVERPLHPLSVDRYNFLSSLPHYPETFFSPFSHFTQILYYFVPAEGEKGVTA